MSSFGTLESDAYFLVFSNRVPELAAQYLRELGQRCHSEEAKFGVVQSVARLRKRRRMNSRN